MLESLKRELKKARFIMVFLGLFILPLNGSAQYTINTVHANLLDCDTMTRGGFIIWWDNDFNYSTQADVMLDTMLAFRETCLNELGMQDPLSVQDGYFCNIYIHTPGNSNDFFTTNFPSWGNGVGGDSNGYPFMTLPSFIISDWRNLAHETFHIFQSHGMWDITPGIYNTNDGGWFVEAAATWFSYDRYPNQLSSFVESEILVRTPHVPIWLGWSNLPSYYPNNWQRQVHQYALSTYLYYLTSVAGVSNSDLVSIFYSGSSLTPQEYLYDLVGGTALRNHFIDCAAHMTNNFDFILPAQANNAVAEWNTYADPQDDNKFLQTYTNSGSNGWFTPEDTLTTNAWSFNTYKLQNSQSETYTFEIDGNIAGSYGDPTFFQGKVLVKNSLSGETYHDLLMTNEHQGSLTLSLTPNDTEVYFIIASMPEVFVDDNPTFQLFPYAMRIVAESTIGFPEINPTSSKIETARYNMMGQKINNNQSGLQLIHYTDGSTQKVYVNH